MAYLIGKTPMIYDSSYDTVFGSIDKDVESQINLYLDDVKKRSIPVATGLNIYYVSPFTDVETGVSSSSAIPGFKHPVILEKDQQKFVVSDIRPFVNSRNTIKEEKLISSNPTELNFTFLRTILNAEFIHDRKELSYKLKFVNTVYAAWISDTIGKRFGLDPEDQLITFIVAYYFFMSLYKEEWLGQDELHLSAKQVADASRVAVSFVLDVADQLTPMAAITDMVENIKTICKNSRLDDLNIGVLATIVSTTWYGTFSKDILAIGLEHVPTFSAVVGVSATQRYYKKSMIAQIAERYGKSGKLEGLITNINHILLEVNRKHA